jgi:phage baseplate assembly protein W
MTPSIYGTGLQYPIQLNSSGSKPKTVSNEELVMLSIEQIIMTDVFERPFLVRNGIPFGTRVSRSLFEPPEVFIDIFRYEVPRALNAWEPRIAVLSADAVQAVDNQHTVQGVVRFRFRATGQQQNFVRPYQLTKTT